MPAAISVNDLTVSYDGNVVLDGVSFRVDVGRLVGVIGPNGAGKSTLLKAMLGLVPNVGGQVHYSGNSLRQVRKDIAYVPQRTSIDWDFPITVLETVLLGTYPSLKLFHRPGKKEKQKAMRCLEEVGMADYATRQISRLSGGQQQRIFIARALAQQAQYFFLDEPFAGVDANSEGTILAILKKLRDEGKTLLVVHHDLAKVRQFFDDVLILNKELVGFGPVAQTFNATLIGSAFAAQLSLLREMGVGA